MKLQGFTVLPVDACDVCSRGKLSNSLGRGPNAGRHLRDDHLIIHSALLGVAARLLALHNDHHLYHTTYSKGQFED